MGEESTNYTYQVASTKKQFQISTPGYSVPFGVYIYGVFRIGRTVSSEILHHSGIEVRLVGGAEICSPRRAHSRRIEVSIISLFIAWINEKKWILPKLLLFFLNFSRFFSILFGERFVRLNGLTKKQPLHVKWWDIVVLPGSQLQIYRWATRWFRSR